MSPADLTKVVGIIVDALAELGPEDRKAALRSALPLLGDPLGAGIDQAVSDGRDGQTTWGTEPRVNAWMKQNGVTAGHLNEAFHLQDGDVKYIGQAHGVSLKEQALNAYVLTGLAAFLVSGDPKFSDSEASHSVKGSGATTHRTTQRI